jgi:pimeloyl-ACP methyl ester carboxylesterase
LLAGIRRKMQRDGSIFTGSGGLLPGAAEEGGDTHFVDAAPDLNATRPMLLLASGLGGGSQDTYVRSMAATAAERGWQVAVVNMRGCGGSPVTSPRLFSAFRGANDDLRLAVSHLRRTRLAGVGDARLAGSGAKRARPDEPVEIGEGAAKRAARSGDDPVHDTSVQLAALPVRARSAATSSG